MFNSELHLLDETCSRLLTATYNINRDLLK